MYSKIHIHSNLSDQLVELLSTIISDKMEYQINPNIQTALAWWRLICLLGVKIKTMIATNMQVVDHKFCKWHSREKDDHVKQIPYCNYKHNILRELSI